MLASNVRFAAAVPAAFEVEMKRWLAVALLLSPHWAQAALVDGVAAVVDGRVITRSEVSDSVALAKRTGLRGGDEERDALEELIERSLVEAEARRLGVEVTDAEVEQAVSEIRSRNGLDPEAFRAALAGQGMEWDVYLAEVRAQILRMKLAGRVLRSKLEVGDEALREFYLKNVADFCESDSLRLYHIQASGPEGRARAEEIRARVAAGEDPEKVARDGEAVGAGDMGYVLVHNLSEDVRRALEKIPTGGVTPVVEMQGSCNLFFVADRKDGRVRPFEEVREQVRERYFREKEQELYRTWIDSLKQKARIVRKL